MQKKKKNQTNKKTPTYPWETHKYKPAASILY